MASFGLLLVIAGALLIYYVSTLPAQATPAQATPAAGALSISGRLGTGAA